MEADESAAKRQRTQSQLDSFLKKNPYVYFDATATTKPKQN